MFCATIVHQVFSHHWGMNGTWADPLGYPFGYPTKIHGGMIKRYPGHIPSGNLLYSYWKLPFIVDLSIENCDVPQLCYSYVDFPIKNGDFPIKNCDFPRRYVFRDCFEGEHQWARQMLISLRKGPRKNLNWTRRGCCDLHLGWSWRNWI